MTGPEIDRQFDETVRTIARLFRDIEFTAEEQQAVEDAGRQLHNFSFETLAGSRDAERLRPFVVMFAMAALLGNHQIFSDGIPALREVPPNDAGQTPTMNPALGR